MRIRRKTKIVATLGPASNSREVIAALIEAGMNVARLNFSHGSHEDHTRVLEVVRAEAKKASVHVAVFQDLCGPKVRISPVADGTVELTEDARITLKHGEEEGSEKELFIESFDPVITIKPGEKALLSDGNVVLIADEVTKDGVVCIVQAGGPVRSRSGVSVPDSKLDIDILTPKDLEDLKWAIEHQVDFVALSFVRSAEDIHQLRQEMNRIGDELPVIAKMERAVSIDNVREIVETSDAVMIARGDLGLELPLERVPLAQKLIIEQANHLGTPVITATQMLQSMVKEVRPTRAEVSDVCTAVLDGTDAVMLSEETAIGDHPIEAVRVLARIVNEAESQFQYDRVRPRTRGDHPQDVADAVAYAACGAAAKVSAAAIIACTQSGSSAKLVAKYRPFNPLIGATSQRKALSRMSLFWGVQPVFFAVEEQSPAEDEVAAALAMARDKMGLKPGSRVVITSGLRAKQSGTTSQMQIREIPRN